MFLVGVGVGEEVDVADGLAEHGVTVGNLVPQVGGCGARVSGLKDDVVEAGISLVTAGQGVADQQAVAAESVLNVWHGR